jgi:hypothetical protein
MLTLRRSSVGIALALIMLLPVAQRASAHADADWELLPDYPDSAYQLWPHQGGAIFALGNNALYRSDDLGESWQALGSPPDGRVIAVDPVNDHTLYARAAPSDAQAGSEVLERSDDDGATWRTLLSYTTAPLGSAIPPLTGYPPQRLAVSPTNDDVLYAYAGDQLMRSSDGGSTWQPLGKISQVGSPCSDAVELLQVDAQNPTRLFTDAGCYAGRDFGFNLAQSTDAGQTFSQFFNHGRGSAVLTGPGAQDANGYPRFLVGVSGRWYLALDPFQGVGPARLFRSDDDGGHWTEVWDTGGAKASSGGLAIDPNNPDTVYVAVGMTDDPDATGVQVSQDAGESWTRLGSPNIGWVHDLTRTADGAALFAATNEGVWRFLNPNGAIEPTK